MSLPRPQPMKSPMQTVSPNQCWTSHGKGMSILRYGHYLPCKGPLKGKLMAGCQRELER
jgi:hypothetical protein